MERSNGLVEPAGAEKLITQKQLVIAVLSFFGRPLGQFVNLLVQDLFVLIEASRVVDGLLCLIFGLVFECPSKDRRRRGIITAGEKGLGIGKRQNDIFGIEDHGDTELEDGLLVFSLCEEFDGLVKADIGGGLRRGAVLGLDCRLLSQLLTNVAEVIVATGGVGSLAAVLSVCRVGIVSIICVVGIVNGGLVNHV